MLTKPQGYDTAPAYSGGGEKLEAGGHICKIMRVCEATSRNGNPFIVFEFDIASSEPQGGFYERHYNRAIKTNPTAKWSGVYWQNTTGQGVPYLKGIITSIEESNNGFKFNWNDPNNERSLCGKLVGGVFGNEEYLANDGKPRMSTKLQQFRSVQAIMDGVDVPEPKLLDPTTYGNPLAIGYQATEGYQAQTSKQITMPSDFDDDFRLMAEDDEVPF
ncbi:MAG: hypothetical protein RSE20_10690 [Eubacterium sp.]